MNKAEALQILAKDAQDVLEHKAVRVSSLPDCDMCNPHDPNQASYDGKTRYTGQWANMCEMHMVSHGVGLGLGMGQRLLTGDCPLPRGATLYGICESCYFGNTCMMKK